MLDQLPSALRCPFLRNSKRLFHNSLLIPTEITTTPNAIMYRTCRIVDLRDNPDFPKLDVALNGDC